MSNKKFQITFQDSDYRVKFFCFLNPGHYFIGGKGADIINLNRQKIEFKSDGKDTGNIFFEKYTFFKGGYKKPGGLEKAKIDGCEIIIFDFWNTSTDYFGTYWFNVDELMLFINSNPKSEILSRNCSPQTAGVLYKIDEIIHLAKKRQPILEDQCLSFLQNQGPVCMNVIFQDFKKFRYSHHQMYSYLAAFFYEQIHCFDDLEVFASTYFKKVKLIR